jgi:hypothetical protein
VLAALLGPFAETPTSLELGAEPVFQGLEAAVDGLGGCAGHESALHGDGIRFASVGWEVGNSFSLSFLRDPWQQISYFAEKQSVDRRTLLSSQRSRLHELNKYYIFILILIKWNDLIAQWLVRTIDS